MLLTLESNLQNVKETIGPIQALLTPSGQEEETNIRKHWKKVRRKFQSMVHARLHKVGAPNAHERFAHKLARWRLDEPNNPLYANLSVIQRTPNSHARCA